MRKLLISGLLAASAAVAGPAAAVGPSDGTWSVTLPGCYGAGATQFCEPTVTVHGVRFNSQAIPVCVSVCVEVPNPTPRLGEDFCFVVTYERFGVTHRVTGTC